MIVLPDCVNFLGAAAWGQVLRTTTWFKSRSVAFPATQMHEIGHNLGMKHSGNDTDSGFDQYADGSGYMANMAVWSEEGNQMCFNAAKTWFFGWYHEQHETIEPTLNEMSFELVALDDIKEDRQGAVNKTSILEIQASGSQSTNLYVVYNRAKGVNSEVVSDRDMVVIIEQGGHTKISKWRGAIGPGGLSTYTQNNWDDTGNILVIEVQSISDYDPDTIDIARIKVYISDHHEENPRQFVNPLPQMPCVDHRVGHSPWHDSDGPRYNCEWYAGNGRCGLYGDKYLNHGHTAQTACCICKEQSVQAILDKNEDISKPTCEDDENWYDLQGTEYTCEWYNEDLNRCKLLGNGYKNFGKTATKACCKCEKYDNDDIH